ncbi:leucine--tRNA ligase [Fimbriimonas ginsengisoli]|nr:leucine--tRNA ligase [Fimbriimonas ginsengisoli]
MADRYEPASFEQKWRDRWQEAELYKTREEEGRPKFYGLDFFPYPSGAGLSVGHARNFVPTDVIARMRYMQGYNVLHPMGFDAFGLPAENEAIKRQSHPAPMIERYAANYQRQMTLIGIGYDWSRSFKSSDPDYYKWTQWIFELLFKRGLAYQKLAAVNWDPVDKTVLADEEVIAGRGERSGALVEKKWIPQWFFKITDYAQRLIDDLDTIDWPEGIKTQQRNWIGRSEGVQFRMNVALGVGENKVYDLSEERPTPNIQRLTFDVFTTRIDTIFGMTFCVLAPEHQLVDKLPVTEDDRARIRAYQEQARTLSDVDRQATTREKTGVFTGAYAINPANGQKVPIWIADYVLATYGTGAIMAVPGHDDRDFEFAQKFDIPVVPVIAPAEAASFERIDKVETADGHVALYSPFSTMSFPLPFITKEGILINSGEYDGMPVKEAQNALGTWIESLGIGERKIQYKLRDWLISRQRYWGCPIPVIHTKEGEMEVVAESALPVELPWVENYEPTGDGTSPLAHIPEFVNVVDGDGRLGRRETDTMGGFACSSWYFLRFADPHNYERGWDPEKAKYWMPVDCYVGGAEHAVMHLLYARFWTKVLYDAGLVTVKEPFQTLRNQGQVLGYTPYRKPREDERLDTGEEGILVSFEEAKALPKDDVVWRWSRMSKSKGNVVTPDEAVAEYGADALRLYLLFRAPFDADIEWENKGMSDLARFLSRIFRVVDTFKPHYEASWRNFIPFEEASDVSKKLRRATHQAIRNVTGDIDRFGFNTYVSWLMKYVNSINEIVGGGVPADDRAAGLAVSEAIETLILLLAPGAPHSADELWESLGNSGFTYHQDWPTYDDRLAAEDTKTIAVQINGKLRDTFEIAAGASDEEHEEAAKRREKVAPHLEGKTVRKVIVVPGKLVNIVAN